LAIVVGEYCVWPGAGDGQCTYDLIPALMAFENRGVGYLSWEWKNVHANWASVTVNDIYQTSSDLSAGGKTTIEHPTLGSKVLAQKASIF
jgi:hypothetical protein